MTTPTAGDRAPALALLDHTGAPFDLKDLRGRKVVVFFYPAAMTPGCTREACDFRDSLQPLQQAGYEVVGVSPDDVATLAEFVRSQELTYRLLSDPDRSTLTRWGAFGEKKLYGKTVTGVIRSTMVVDEGGTITLARRNVRATGHVASLRKALGV